MRRLYNELRSRSDQAKFGKGRLDRKTNKILLPDIICGKRRSTLPVWFTDGLHPVSAGIPLFVLQGFRRRHSGGYDGGVDRRDTAHEDTKTRK